MKKPKNNSAGMRLNLKSFSVRELALAGITLWVAAILTGLFAFKEFRALREKSDDLEKQCALQDITLEIRETVEARLAEHVKRLESAESLEGSTLQGLVDTLARASMLRAENITPKTENKGAFQILSVKMSFRDAPMDRLLVFDDRLRTQKIPLAITGIRIEVGNRDSLNVTYDIATYHLRDKK